MLKDCVTPDLFKAESLKVLLRAFSACPTGPIRLNIGLLLYPAHPHVYLQGDINHEKSIGLTMGNGHFRVHPDTGADRFH